MLRTCTPDPFVGSANIWHYLVQSRSFLCFWLPSRRAQRRRSGLSEPSRTHAHETPPPPFIVGAQLFQQFSIRDFHTQQRAPDDPEHIALINKVYRCSRLPPITANDLKAYKVLTAEDFAAEPEWREAPILVASNVERDELNLQQATRFAQDHGHPVVRWRLPGKSVPVPESAYDDNPSMWGVFVRDAPAMLMENMNVKRSLCNGTLGHMHSLTFAQGTPQEAHNAHTAQQLIANADPGQIVDLPAGMVPLTVNFVPNAMDATVAPRPDTPSLSQDALVVPVPPHKHKNLKDQPWWRLIDSTGEPHYRRVTLLDHGIRLAFAITFWKVQRRFACP